MKRILAVCIISRNFFAHIRGLEGDYQEKKPAIAQLHLCDRRNPPDRIGQGPCETALVSAFSLL